MSDTIREFLIAIGFAADEGSRRKAEDAQAGFERTVTTSDKRTTKAQLREALIRGTTEAKSFGDRVRYAEKLEEIDKRFGGLALRRTLRQAAKHAETDEDRIKWLTRLRKAEEEHHQRSAAGLTRIASVAVGAALAVQGAALAFAGYATQVAAKLEAMAYASDRTKSSVADLKVFSQAVSQLGGTAGGALNDLESFAERLRSNPQGYTAFLKSVGVEARDAKGNIRGAADLYKEFRKNVGASKPYEQQLLYAQEMGISEQTWRATDPAKLAAEEAAERAKHARMGFNPDAAKEDAKGLQHAFRDMWDSISIVGEKAASKIFADVGGNLKSFTTFVEQHGDQIAEILSKVAQIVLAVSRAFLELATSDRVKSFLDGVLNTFGKVDDATGKWTANTEGIKNALEALAIFVATVFVAKITGAFASILKDLKPLLFLLSPFLGALGLPALGALGITGALVAGSDPSKGVVHGGRPDINGNDLGLPGVDANGNGSLGPRKAPGDTRSWYERIAPKFLGGKDAPSGAGGGREDDGGSAPRGDGTGTRGAAPVGKMMAYAMDQLRREGVPEKQLRQSAAHLVGQATMESGLDPNKVHDSGTGYGIYGARDPKGWGDYKGARRSQMVKWLEKNGYARNSAEGQMRYMAHEAMSGGYGTTKRILMGEGSGNITADTNAITREFEAPAIINHRAGAVERALRIGPEQAAPASLDEKPSAGLLPNGAPAVLKPKSMPDAPGVVMDLDTSASKPAPEASTPPASPEPTQRAPDNKMTDQARDAIARFNDALKTLDTGKLRTFGEATQGFDPGKFFVAPPVGTEGATNNSSVKHQTFNGGTTNITQNVAGGADEGAAVFRRHKERQNADDVRYASSMFA